jgi:hypothetical protein
MTGSAKQSRFFETAKKAGLLRRFAPRNDGALIPETPSPPQRAAPEALINLSPLRGRGECRVPRTRSRACSVGNTRVSHHEYAGHPAFPHAMVLTAYFVLSPAIGLFVTVIHGYGWPAPGRAGFASANLTPASRRQDHTTSPSAATSFVGAPFDRSRALKPALQPRSRPTLPRPPHPAPTFVTMANALFGTGWHGYRFDLGKARSGKLSQGGLDTMIEKLPDGQITRSPPPTGRHR